MGTFAVVGTYAAATYLQVGSGWAALLAILAALI